MKKTDYFIGKSIINSTFKCKILNSITKKDKEFIIPEISGRAWITGFHPYICLIQKISYGLVVIKSQILG